MHRFVTYPMVDLSGRTREGQKLATKDFSTEMRSCESKQSKRRMFENSSSKMPIQCYLHDSQGDRSKDANGTSYLRVESSVLKVINYC